MQKLEKYRIQEMHPREKQCSKPTNRIFSVNIDNLSKTCKYKDKQKYFVMAVINGKASLKLFCNLVFCCFAAYNIQTFCFTVAYYQQLHTKTLLKCAVPFSEV